METREEMIHNPLSRQILAKFLFILAGIIIIGCQIWYFIKAYGVPIEKKIPVEIHNIFRYGIWIGISILFGGLTMYFPDKRLKLFFSWICFFNIFIFLIFLTDLSIFDELIKSTKIILSLIITTFIWIIYCLYLLLNG